MNPRTYQSVEYSFNALKENKTELEQKLTKYELEKLCETVLQIIEDAGKYSTINSYFKTITIVETSEIKDLAPEKIYDWNRVSLSEDNKLLQFDTKKRLVVTSLSNQVLHIYIYEPDVEKVENLNEFVHDLQNKTFFDTYDEEGEAVCDCDDCDDTYISEDVYNFFQNNLRITDADVIEILDEWISDKPDATKIELELCSKNRNYFIVVRNITKEQEED